MFASSLLGLLAALVAGCSQAKPAPPPATIGSSSNSIVPSASVSSPGSPGDVLQSSLPLTVTEPADASTVVGTSITVKGTTSPGATVTVNDNLVTADGSGAFSTVVNLDEGLNAIDVTATDSNNHQGEVLLMVNADTTSAPVSAGPGAGQGVLPLTVTQPTDAADISASTVTVRGQTSPGATVIVNGDSTGTADANGNFSIGVSLNRGPNAIQVVATDDSGNEAETLVMVNGLSGS